MTEKYTELLEISASDKNTVERFINTILKRSERGREEFGVNIVVKRAREIEDDELPENGGFNDE